MTPTATTSDNLPLYTAGFATLHEGLEYAARGKAGYNFYSARGELERALTYSELRERAIDAARRLVKAGLKPESRVVLIADTDADFAILFFACQYAGLLPVPVALPTTLGGRDSYIAALRRQMIGCGAGAAVAPAELISYLREAASGLDLPLVGTPDDFYDLPRGDDLRPFMPRDRCYLQYSSGSTRTPLGVDIPQRVLMSNCHAIINHGLLAQPGDRCTSWLPLYHDMGLVGMALGPLYSGRPGVFLATQAFVKRPADWLRAISRHRATVSFAPSFAYDLCLRRVKDRDLDGLDLSCWRVAGCGAEPIHAAALAAFAARFAPCGFRETSFLPGYGLAEHTVAATFAPRGRPLRVERVAPGSLSERGEAVLAADDEPSAVHVVCCGAALPGHELRVVDEAGCALGERQVGEIVLSGPSVMLGYHNEPELTRHTIRDGWLWTGDLGYVADGELFVCGRLKDLIIVGGRKFHPQDLEWAVDELPGIRGGRVAAFGAAHGGRERVVMVVEPNGTVPSDRLVEAVRRRVADLMGLYVDDVVLVPSGTVGRTTSGKVQRANAKARYERGELELAGEVKGARGGPPPRAAPSPRR